MQFDRKKRLLFVAAAGLALAGVVVPFAAWAIVAKTGFGFGVVRFAWVGLTGGAVLALVGGVGWRAAEAVAPRLRSG